MDREGGWPVTVVCGVASRDRDLTFREAALVAEFRGLGGPGERDLCGQVATRIPQDPATEVQGGAVWIQGEGAVHRHQRLGMFSHLPRRVPCLVPGERQVGVEGDRFLDPVESLRPVAKLDVGGPDEGEGKTFTWEVRGGVLGGRKGILPVRAGAEQLEELAPSSAIVGVVGERRAIGELRVLRTPFVGQRARAREAPGPGLGGEESVLCA